MKDECTFRGGGRRDSRMIVITHLGEIMDLASLRAGDRSFNSTLVTPREDLLRGELDLRP